MGALPSSEDSVVDFDFDLAIDLDFGFLGSQKKMPNKKVQEVDNKEEDDDDDDEEDDDDDDDDDLADEIAKLTLSTITDAPRVQDVPDAPVALTTLAHWILRDCQKVVILSGAGVSVAAGIPDFRTPGTGLYDNLAKYNLPFPEAVFDVDFYKKNPQPFVSLAREIWPGMTHSPTLTHCFMSLLASKGKLLRVYTQNIDGLEVLAQLAPEKIVECHGHFRTASVSFYFL
jgi:NAD+-dependent protein deacetylase sirtuin 2